MTKATAEEVLYQKHPNVDYCCYDRKIPAAAGKHRITKEKSLFWSSCFSETLTISYIWFMSFLMLPWSFFFFFFLIQTLNVFSRKQQICFSSTSHDTYIEVRRIIMPFSKYLKYFLSAESMQHSLLPSILPSALVRYIKIKSNRNNQNQWTYTSKVHMYIC